MEKKHPKSEQDEIVLVVNGKVKDLISYAQIFGLRDRPLQMLFAQNNRRKTKAYVSNVLQRLPEDIVTGLIQERRFDEIAAYERVFNIFDGNSPEALEKARNFWKELKQNAADIFYWQQTSDGSWQQKG